MSSNAREPALIADARESAGPARILIVDDHRENITALEAVLEPLGQPVISVESGEEALRVLLHTEVSVILLDVRMAGMSGVETARFIRLRRATRDIPIIFLTAMASDAQQIELAYEAGAVDYVIKPFEPSILRAKVMAFVTLRHERVARMRQAGALARAEASARAARMVQSLSDAALAHLELAPLATELVDRACALFQAAGGALLLRDPDGGPLSRFCEQGSGWPDAAEILDPQVQDLITMGMAGLLGPEEPGWSALAPDAARQLIAIPLLSSESVELLGMLLLSADDPETFDGADLALLELAGDRIAAAVSHAQRYEHQRELVETLQRSLLPANLPAHPRLELAARYLPEGSGNRVGGDWYDALTLSEHRIALMIGDVVGHGVVAAARMGELRNALRAYAIEGHGPAAALGHLNQLVQTSFGQGMAATVLFAMLDLRTRSLTLARAGHPPPVVRSPDGTVRALDSGGTLPLGVAANQAVSEFTYALADGETLLLYTDGLVERRDEVIDAGLARLMTAFGGGDGAATSTCDRVLERVLGDEPPADDVAILAAHVCPILSGPLTLELEASPESVSIARHRLRDWLRHELPDLDPTTAADLELAFSEATSNVVRHAYGAGVTGRLRACASRDVTGVELAVQDHGAWRAPGRAGGGLGLGLIEAVCDRLEVESDSGGTLVRMRWLNIG